MRMTFSTPVTPTRERLTGMEGRRAWTSLPRRAAGSVIGRLDDTYVQSEANRTSRCTIGPSRLKAMWPCPHGQPFAVLTAAQHHPIYPKQTAPGGLRRVEGVRVDEA